MKSNTIRALLLITIFFMIAVNSNAQKNVDSNAHHNLAVKWSPLGIYFGKLTLGGEYSIRCDGEGCAQFARRLCADTPSAC